MEDLELRKEEKHLNSAVKVLKQAKDQMEKSVGSLGRETVHKLEELRKNRETDALDFFMYLEQIHEKHQAFNLKDKFKRIEELSQSLDAPYFARIDLKNKSEGTAKKIYIGKFGYSDKDMDEPLITDWRSKIGSVYYHFRYPQKNVKYETPEGTKIRDLTLKRTFDISEGALNKYYNNDIHLDENEIIAEKIEGRTGGVLEDIVETIQESQLDIIEEDPRSPCIVQGCVGSGKSTVAIHKLSHIFFNYPKLINPTNSILIAKKQVLVSYLATLFPKLGIFDINYKTLGELIYNFVFRENVKIKTDFSLVAKEEIMSLETLEKARDKIEKVERDYAKKLDAVFEGTVKTYGGYTYDPDATPYENIKYVIKELTEELGAQTELLKERPNSTRTWLYNLNIDSLKKILKKLKELIEDLRGKTFRNLIKESEINPKTKLDYASTLFYIYHYARIIGFSKTQRYQYCVVDEGQDFSPLEYAVLDQFVLHKRFCVLGDLNQSYTTSGLQNWEELKKVLQITDAKEFRLDTNYRSTKPIIILANKILEPFTDNYLPKSINRKGEEPKIFESENMKELTNQIRLELKQDLKDLKKSVGIICYDKKYLNLMTKVLEELPIDRDRKVILTGNKRIDYKPRNIYLTEFENCKGLEFAKVYIVGRNPLKNENFEEAKKSFIGITRAMDKLSLYYLKD